MRLSWKKDTMLYVEFLDISVDPGWKSEKLAMTRPPVADTDCSSLGFFSKADKEFLYLTNMKMGGARDRTVIPIGCIQKIRKLYFKLK